LCEYKKYLTTRYIFDNLDISNQEFPTEHQQYEDANNKIQIIKEQHNNLKLVINEIEKNALNQKLHVFKLLLKAAKENHDKVKLWWRLFDYSYNTGISYYEKNMNSLMSIFEAIEEVHNSGKSHKLSNDFLVSQFVLVLSDRLIKALYAIINKDKHLLQENAGNYIYACLDSSLLQRIFAKENISDMEYYVKSFKYLRLSLGATCFIIGKKDDIKPFNLLDWQNDPQGWCQINNIDFDKYLYYLMYKLNDKTSSNCFQLWNTMAEHSKNSKEFLTPFKVSEIIVRSEPNGMITLYEWIQKCGVLAENPTYTFDPRLSEWMALRIVDKLIELHIQENTPTAKDLGFLTTSLNPARLKRKAIPNITTAKTIAMKSSEASLNCTVSLSNF
jgi:hypothetical protein